MKKVLLLLTGLFLIGIFVILTNRVLAAPSNAVTRVRKIVVYEPKSLLESQVEDLVKGFGGRKIKNLKLINGQAVELPLPAVERLKKEKGIIRVDDDVVVQTLGRDSIFLKKIKPTPTPTPAPAQTLPWGIDRIDAEQVWSTTKGDPIKVGVIDTGIDLNHPDLAANIKDGVSTVWYTSSYNDDNGHGTHVAGIIAALDNTFGVVGVGPEIDLYAIKVLDRRGSGYLSDVIEGLDWAVAHEMQVVNMSLGTSSDVQSLHDAVARVNAAGIVQVAAAGNSGGAVNYPAAYPEVIAVSATDQNDVIASWSSRGPEVDLAAPGVNIYSTYKGSKYQTMSGTSMASPHVAGVAALVLSVPSKCEYLLDSMPGCSPAEVQKRLESTADDLGVSGKDDLYGYGLVDAERAVTW